MAGAPLRELMSHARFAGLATIDERGFAAPRNTSAVAAFGDIPGEAHPPSLSKLPPCLQEALKLPLGATRLEASSLLGRKLVLPEAVEKEARSVSGRMSRSGRRTRGSRRGAAALSNCR